MAGIDIFPEREPQTITIRNLDDVTEHTEYFSMLLGLSLLATKVSQKYFDRAFDDDKKYPVGEAIDGKYYYQFSAKTAIEALLAAGKDPGIWKNLDPDATAMLIESACEVAE